MDHEELPQRVVVERLAAPALVVHAVGHRFRAACTRQGCPRADNGHNVADGISALSIGIGYARANAVGIVERDRRAVPPCMRVCGSLVVRCSVTGLVRGVRGPEQFNLKRIPRIKKSLLKVFRKPSEWEGRHLRFTTGY